MTGCKFRGWNTVLRLAGTISPVKYATYFAY